MRSALFSAGRRRRPAATSARPPSRTCGSRRSAPGGSCVRGVLPRSGSAGRRRSPSAGTPSRRVEAATSESPSSRQRTTASSSTAPSVERPSVPAERAQADDGRRRPTDATNACRRRSGTGRGRAAARRRSRFSAARARGRRRRRGTVVRDGAGGDGVEQMLRSRGRAAAEALVDVAREVAGARRGRAARCRPSRPRRRAGSSGSAIPFACAISVEVRPRALERARELGEPAVATRPRRRTRAASASRRRRSSPSAFGG